MQLPELAVSAIAAHLPVQAQAAFRLTCRSLRDHLPVQNLGHSIRLSPQGNWKTQAKKLKSIAPNVKVLIWQAEGIQHCIELLGNPFYGVVRLHTYFESRDPAECRNAETLRNARDSELSRLECLRALAVAPATSQADLQLDMTVKYAEPKHPPLQAAFKNLAPFIAGLSIIGDFRVILQNTVNFSHLSRLELTLPNAACARSDARAVEFLQNAFRSLPKLTYVQLNADSLSVQPFEVLGVLAELPNITSLKVDSGISPCRLAAAHLIHVTSLCLVREVYFDHPTGKLQILHLAYLSLAQRKMLLQLRQMSRGVDVTTGCHDAEGFAQTPCSHPKCCLHHSLAADHCHVCVEDVAQASMQPRLQLCDKGIETSAQLV